MIRHRVVRRAMAATTEDEQMALNELTRGAGHNWRLVCITPLWVEPDRSIMAQYTFQEVD